MSTLTEDPNGDRATSRGRLLAEMLLWGVLGLAVAFGMLAFRPVPLSNDSCQYLSVAANIRAGNGAATDLVYFDTERSHGRIPAFLLGGRIDGRAAGARAPPAPVPGSS